MPSQEHTYTRNAAGVFKCSCGTCCEGLRAHAATQRPVRSEVLGDEIQVDELSYETYASADMVEVITASRHIFPVRMCHCMTSPDEYTATDVHGFPLDLEWGVKLGSCRIRVLSTRAT